MALAWLQGRSGHQAVDKALLRFIGEFPPLTVYKEGIDPAAYLEGTTAGVPHRQMVLEEQLATDPTDILEQSPKLRLVGTGSPNIQPVVDESKAA